MEPTAVNVMVFAEILNVFDEVILETKNTPFAVNVGPFAPRKVVCKVMGVPAIIP